MTGRADSDHWLFKRHLALLFHLSFAQVYEVFVSFYEEEDKHVAVMFHGKSKVAAALHTNDDFSLLLHGDVSFVGQEHVDDSGRLSTFNLGSLTRPPVAHYVSSFKPWIFMSTAASLIEKVMEDTYSWRFQVQDESSFHLEREY